MRCVVYCISEHLSLKALASFLKEHGYSCSLRREFLHIRKFQDVEDILFFSYGCIVFWNSTAQVENILVKAASPYARNPLHHPVTEEFSYEIDRRTESSIYNDRIVLSDPSRLMDKIAISFGLTQSIKLSVFENTLEKVITKTRDYPVTMAEKGKISLSRKEIAKSMGEIFIVRNSINLHARILDTPHFLWEYPEYEKLYTSTITDQDTKERSDLLNKRLDMIQELYAMFSSELQHRHSSLLEWIIIVLIAVETFLFIAKELM